MKLQTLRSWVSRHRALAPAIGMSSLLLLASLWPPYEPIFVAQRTLLGLAQISIGAAWLVLWPLALIPYPANRIFMAVLAGGCLCLLILGLKSLWHRNIWSKALAAGLVGLELVVGLFAATSMGSFVGSAYAICEHNVSESSAIRIVAYPEVSFFPGAYLFGLATRDAGRTWSQVFVFRHDDLIDPRCESIRARSSMQYWVWTGWTLAVTTDGGHSWQKWVPTDTWPSWRCCNYRLIQDVIFQDDLHGHMVLNPIAGRGENPNLYTDDGGQSWHE